MLTITMIRWVNILWIFCIFSCLTLHNEHELNLGQWLDIDLSKPDCDVVEVRCKQPNSMQYTTDVSGQNEKDLWVHDLHIQIVDSSRSYLEVIGTTIATLALFRYKPNLVKWIWCHKMEQKNQLQTEPKPARIGPLGKILWLIRQLIILAKFTVFW